MPKGYSRLGRALGAFNSGAYTSRYRMLKQLYRSTRKKRRYPRSGYGRVPSTELKQFAWNFSGVTPISVTTGNKFILNWNRGLPSTTTVGTAVDTTTPFVLGTGPYQRLGSEIMIHRCEFRCDLQMNAVAAAGMVVRLIIFIDKSPEGNTFTLADILYDTGSTLGVYSPQKHSTRREFRILSDRLYVLRQAGPGATGSTIPRQVKWRKRFNPPLKINYYPSAAAGTEATESGIQENGVCVVAMADVANGAMTNVYSNVLFSDS